MPESNWVIRRSREDIKVNYRALVLTSDKEDLEAHKKKRALAVRAIQEKLKCLGRDAVLCFCSEHRICVGLRAKPTASKLGLTWSCLC